MLKQSEKRLKSSKESNMGLRKILAKTYGNYFLTVQGVKVMKTIKKDDNAVVGLGKLFIADKLMDTARWLIKPEEREWNFSGDFLLLFLSNRLLEFWNSGSLSTVVGWSQLSSRKDKIRPFFFDIENDKNSVFEVFKVPKSKGISFDKFNEIIGRFHFGVGIG